MKVSTLLVLGSVVAATNAMAEVSTRKPNFSPTDVCVGATIPSDPFATVHKVQCLDGAVRYHDSFFSDAGVKKGVEEMKLAMESQGYELTQELRDSEFPNYVFVKRVEGSAQLPQKFCIAFKGYEKPYFFSSQGQTRYSVDCGEGGLLAMTTHDGPDTSAEFEAIMKERKHFLSLGVIELNDFNRFVLLVHE